MEIKSLDEQLDDTERKRNEYFKDKLENGWGNWKYDSRSNSLVHQDNSYFIEIKRIKNCYSLVDWLLHLKEKTWITEDDIADFLTAIEDLGGELRGKEKFILDVLNITRK